MWAQLFIPTTTTRVLNGKQVLQIKKSNQNYSLKHQNRPTDFENKMKKSRGENFRVVVKVDYSSAYAD